MVVAFRPLWVLICFFSTLAGSKKGLDITKLNLNDLLKSLTEETQPPQSQPSPQPSSTVSQPVASTNLEPKSAATNLKVCINSTRDLEEQILGRWEHIEGEKLPVSFLSSASSADEWFASACPVELVTASCYFQRNREIARRAESRKFTTSDCSLNPLNSSKLLNLLSNRKVLFAFDGISKQFWIYIVCLLRSVDSRTEFNVNWIPEKDLSDEEKRSCSRGSKHCRFTSATAYFPKFSVTFIYQHMVLHGRLSHKKFDVIGMFKSLNLNPADLVVANFGHNFHQGGASYRNFLRKLSDDYEFGVLKMRRSMPTMLWMETSAQHFPNSKGNNGYYDGPDEVKQGNCTPIPDLM